MRFYGPLARLQVEVNIGLLGRSEEGFEFRD